MAEPQAKTDLLHGKLQFSLVTPSAALLSEELDEVRAPGIVGGFGVLPGHAPFLTELGAGVLTTVGGGKEDHYAVSGGFCEVAENRVTVLADFAQHASTIDPAEAQRELETAMQAARDALAKDQAEQRRIEATVRLAGARLAASKLR
jgi:F-type H+-transporting ATPase subunit epsilon